MSSCGNTIPYSLLPRGDPLAGSAGGPQIPRERGALATPGQNQALEPMPPAGGDRSTPH